MNLGVTIELVLAFLLVTTIVYCYSLNNKINNVLSLEDERSDLIESLNIKIEEGLKLRHQLEAMLIQGAKLDRASSVRQDLPRVKSPSLSPALGDMNASFNVAERARVLREKRVSEIGHA